MTTLRSPFAARNLFRVGQTILAFSAFATLGCITDAPYPVSSRTIRSEFLPTLDSIDLPDDLAAALGIDSIAEVATCDGQQMHPSVLLISNVDGTRRMETISSERSILLTELPRCDLIKLIRHLLNMGGPTAYGFSLTDFLECVQILARIRSPLLKPALIELSRLEPNPSALSESIVLVAVAARGNAPLGSSMRSWFGEITTAIPGLELGRPLVWISGLPVVTSYGCCGVGIRPSVQEVLSELDAQDIGSFRVMAENARASVWLACRQLSGEQKKGGQDATDLVRLRRAQMIRALWQSVVRQADDQNLKVDATWSKLLDNPTLFGDFLDSHGVSFDPLR